MCFIPAPCCWRIFTCAPSEFILPFHYRVTSRVWQHQPDLKKKALHSRTAYNSVMPTQVKWKVFLRSDFFCSDLQLWICFTNVCRTSITELSLSWGFYGEIKEKQEGYLQLSWHSKSEDGVDCSPLIEDTFERCLAVCQTGFHWSGNPGARGTSSGRVSHDELYYCVKYMSNVM